LWRNLCLREVLPALSINGSSAIDETPWDFRFPFGGSSGGTWFVNFGRSWTAEDDRTFSHVVEMACVDVLRRIRALTPKGIMSPLL